MSKRYAWNPQDPPDDRALAASTFIDIESEIIAKTIDELIDDSMSQRDIAVQLFNHVRDAVRYDPYRITLNQDEYRGSHSLESKYGFCVPKAITYTTLLRAAGIPALLGFADVTNHLSSEKLRAAVQSDVFVYHGYSVLWLDGKWLQATPTFNRSLSERAGVPVLEFDGYNDALLSPYDNDGKLHMEYLNDRGWHWDFDFEGMVDTFRAYYPHWFKSPSFHPAKYLDDTSDFEDDVERRS